MTGIPITPSQPAVAMTRAELSVINTSGLIPGFLILEEETGIIYQWTGQILVRIN